MMNKIPPLVSTYLKEVKTKFGLNIELKPKLESKFLTFVSPFIKLFNPNYDRYITTLGNTVYFPNDEWFTERTSESSLEVIAHETKHCLDFNKNKIGYVVGYGFPQILAIPVVLTLLLTVGWWGLLGLLLVLPFPSWWRMKHEVDAYVVSFIVYPILAPKSNTDAFFENWIVEKLTKRWYYWAWPFPKQVVSMIQKQKLQFNKDSFYLHLVDFCYRNSI